MRYMVTVTEKGEAGREVEHVFYRGDDKQQSLRAMNDAATRDFGNGVEVVSVRRDQWEWPPVPEEGPEQAEPVLGASTTAQVQYDVNLPPCSGDNPDNKNTVPYCRENEGGCALHYPTDHNIQQRQARQESAALSKKDEKVRRWLSANSRPGTLTDVAEAYVALFKGRIQDTDIVATHKAIRAHYYGEF